MNIDPGVFAYFGCESALTNVEFWDTTFAAGFNISELAALRKLDALKLVRVPVKEAQFDKISVLATLKSLALTVRVLPPRVWASICKLHQIQRLEITGPISDAQIQELAAMTDLKQLVLRNTLATDEGVSSLVSSSSGSPLVYLGDNPEPFGKK